MERILATQGDEGCGDGLGCVLLVRGVGEGGGVGAGDCEGSQFEGYGGAGEVVDGADGGGVRMVGMLAWMRERPSWLARRRLRGR